VISKEIAEMLAGHAGYLTGSYRRYTKKQLAEQYLKGERMLLIHGDPDIGEIREQLDSTTKDLQATKQGGERTATALSSVVIENQGLKEQLNAMINEIQEMQNAAAGHTSEIAELREQTKAISKLVETLMSENVKTQNDKALVHGASVAKSLLRSPRKK
jgi:predicted  nucleic acid-binding Zn-ribbon protein